MVINPNRLEKFSIKSRKPEHRRPAKYKDHESSSEHWCEETNPTTDWVCTRPKRHKGWHESVAVSDYPEGKLKADAIWPPKKQ